MTTLSPALDAALAGDRPLVYGSIEINLPSKNIRLLDGSGSITVGGNTFTGEDSTFGTLDSIDELNDGLGDEAPALSIRLLPKSEAAVADLAAPNMQGSRVRLRLGAIDLATGTVIGEQLCFDGEIDVPMLEVGRGTRSLELECVSSFERFFEVNEGARLSDAYQQSIWPGETGLANTTGLETTLAWGAPTSTVSGSNVASGGGSYDGYYDG